MTNIKEHSSKVLIHFQDAVGKTEYGEFGADKPLNLTLHENEIGVIFGGIEAARILRAAAGRGALLNGSITICDQTLTSKTSLFDLHRLKRSEIGFGFREGSLLSNRSLLGNITLPIKYYEANTEIDEKELRERAVLELTKLNVPEKFWKLRPAYVPQEVRKRTILARSICLNPKILLLDDPLTFIPWCSHGEIIEWIYNQKKNGKGILMATHDAPCGVACGDFMYDVTKNTYTEKIGEYFGSLATQSAKILNEQRIS